MGLIDGYGAAFTAAAAASAALFLFTLLAVPGGKSPAIHHSHGH